MIGQVFREMYPSESQLRDMIDTIPALAWSCLPDGANEFTNKRWRDYTGLSQAEAFGSGWQRTFHPDDLGKVMENWRAVQASGEPSGVEARAAGRWRVPMDVAPESSRARRLRPHRQMARRQHGYRGS